MTSPEAYGITAVLFRMQRRLVIDGDSICIQVCLTCNASQSSSVGTKHSAEGAGSTKIAEVESSKPSPLLEAHVEDWHVPEQQHQGEDYVNTSSQVLCNHLRQRAALGTFWPQAHGNQLGAGVTGKFAYMIVETIGLIRSHARLEAER